MWQLSEIPILVFYWNTITLIHLCIICGCFCIPIAELSSCERDKHTKLTKTKIFTIWSFTDKACWPLDKIIIWSVHNPGMHNLLWEPRGKNDWESQGKIIFREEITLELGFRVKGGTHHREPLLWNIFTPTARESFMQTACAKCLITQAAGTSHILQNHLNRCFRVRSG